MTGYMEFTYTKKQVEELADLLRCNKRFSAALAVAIYDKVFPEGTDPVLILELLERIKQRMDNGCNVWPLCDT